MPADPRELLDALRVIASHLRDAGVSTNEITAALAISDAVPATAFAIDLTPLEVLTRLRTDAELAVLGRPVATLAQARRNSIAKHSRSLSYKPTDKTVPLSIFANRSLSFQEHICVYLRDTYKLRNNEIAELLGMDQRVVWTVLHRAEKKRGART